jgi:hypothetical protein
MEAVSTIGNRVSRKVVVAVAIVATFTLGGGSGYLVKTLSLPAAHFASQSSASQVGIESPRSGGPGSQIGDAAQPDQTTRVGGPGGQFVDAP